MKSVKILITITAIALLSTSVLSVAENTCDVYKCSETKPSTATGQCYQESTDANGSTTFTFNQCEDKYYCYSSLALMANTLSTSAKTANCAYISNLDTWLDYAKDLVSGIFSNDLDTYLESNALAINRVDGQKCKKDSNCYNGTCTDEKCTGKEEGASCTVNAACKVGYACIGSVCTAQKDSGESCTNAYDCKNNMTCSNGVCTTYYSKPDGSVVSTNKACSSGVFIFDTANANYKCDTPTIKSQDCSSSADTCTIEYSNTKITYEVGCQCQAWTSDRARTCSLGTVSKTTYYDNRHTDLRKMSDINAYTLSADIDLTSVNDYPECFRKSIYNNLNSTIMKVSGIFVAALLALLF